MAKDKLQAIKQIALDNGAEITDATAEAIAKYFANQPKEPTRTKTFRFPTDILEWLEEQAVTNGRSPNAELVERLRNEKASA